METSTFSFKKSFKFASSEYVHWITNPKLIILSMMIVFIYEFDIRPLVDAAELINDDTSDNVPCDNGRISALAGG